MNITNAKYVNNFITGESLYIKAEIDEKDVIIPLDPNNHHYAEIMQQVEAGTLTIAPADEE